MANAYNTGFLDPTYKPTNYDDPKWVGEFMKEHIGTFRFNKLMGGTDKPVQYKYELKSRGEFMKLPLLGAARKRGVVNNMALQGREEQADQHIFNIGINLFRHAFAVTEWDERRSPVELMPHLRPVMMDWIKDQSRDHMIDAMFSVALNKPMATPLRNPDPTQVLPGDPAIVNIQTQATAAELNTWMTDNNDRVVFGTSNPADAPPVAGNFAGSVAAMGAADKFGTGMIDIMKDKADTAHQRRGTNPGYGIRPLKIGGDDETGYVILASLKAFNQLKTDSVLMDFNKALVSGAGKDSGENNPYFTSADLMWNNCVIKRVPEIGEHNATTGRVVMMGAQAMIYAQGDDISFRPAKDDYDHLHGLAIRESCGIGKLQRELTNGKKVDANLITGFCRL
jgi:hypothetical protein